MKFILGLLAFFALYSCCVATFGVDVSQAVSEADWACLKRSNYDFAVIRCYESLGRVDPNAVATVGNAHRAGIAAVHVYMFPCKKCRTSPEVQVADAINNLRNHGAKFDTFWFDIEGSQYWESQSANRAFLTAALNKAVSMGVKVGIYTSASQWEPIFGNWNGGSRFPLWYAHYDGTPNFNDFRAFGGWSKPAVKQYAGDISRCGVGLDEDWY